MEPLKKKIFRGIRVNLVGEWNGLVKRELAIEVIQRQGGIIVENGEEPSIKIGQTWMGGDITNFD